MIPKDLKYTKEHEWVKIEGKEAVMGITDYAQSQLGDVTFIDLPSKGRAVNQSESVATVESVKAASDIYAPVAGKITGVNDSLSETPEAINKDPYGKGWICRIEITNNKEVEGLLSAEAYEKYIEGLKG